MQPKTQLAKNSWLTSFSKIKSRKTKKTKEILKFQLGFRSRISAQNIVLEPSGRLEGAREGGLASARADQPSDNGNPTLRFREKMT